LLIGGAVSELVVQLMLTVVCFVRSAVLIGEVDGVTMTVGSVGWTGIAFSASPVINWQLSL
jgi:hypothetical protein